MANDTSVHSHSNTAAYYQSSFVIAKKELKFRSAHLFVFNQIKVIAKISFSAFFSFLNFETVCSFQIRILQKSQKQLHQNLSSFINQFVFMNEIITSNNTYKSLYKA